MLPKYYLKNISLQHQAGATRRGEYCEKMRRQVRQDVEEGSDFSIERLCFFYCRALIILTDGFARRGQ